MGLHESGLDKNVGEQIAKLTDPITEAAANGIERYNLTGQEFHEAVIAEGENGDAARLKGGAGFFIGSVLGVGGTTLGIKATLDSGVVNAVEKTSTLGKTIGDYSLIKPGPLADNLAGTFSGGRYTTIKLEHDTILYRSGTANQPLGQFFSLEQPVSVLQTRIDKAVLPVWPGGAVSPLDTVYAIKIPAGTSVYVGEVGYQSGFYLGGSQQIVVPKPWTIQGVQVINSSPLK